MKTSTLRSRSYLSEAKEVSLSFSDRVEQNMKMKKIGSTARITPAFYNWFVKKFSGKLHYSVTPVEDAIKDQRISLRRKHGSMGSRHIFAKLFGDYIMVVDDGGGTKSVNRFYLSK